MAEALAKYGFVTAAFAVVLALASLHSYLLFHFVAEMFGVLISIGVFLLALNARRIMRNDFAFFLSLALAASGVFDLFHILLYDEYSLFVNFGTNAALQLTIASRFMLAISFIVAPAFLTRKLNVKIAVVAYVLAAVFFAQSIFYWRIAPDTFADGVMTAFKTASELAIAGMFVVAIFVFRRKRKLLDQRVVGFICLSIALNAAAGFMLALYEGIYHWANISGHIIRVVAFYAIYKALIEIALTQPYRLLFYELEKNSSFKDDLLSIVSHDLKTPVTSIQLLSETLERQLPQDNKFAHAVGVIKREANEMGKLVNDFLEFGRIESGRIKLEMDKFDICKLVEALVETQSLVSPTSNIEVVVCEGVFVEADKDRIRQVISNLLTNAVKYSPEGGSVIVSAKQEHNRVYVSIQDFGRGISKEDIGKVFQKYVRAVSEGQSSGGGLGLYIAKTFVELHYGEIWVESEPGKGSTFHFWIPVKQPQELLKAGARLIGFAPYVTHIVS